MCRIKFKTRIYIITKQYKLFNLVNDLILKIFKNTSKTDTSLLYLLRLAVLHEGLRCLPEIVNSLINNIKTGDATTKFQSYLALINCFNTNQGKLEVFKKIINEDFFEDVVKDYEKQSNQLKIAISALIQNICIELIALDSENNVNDLATEIICFINSYVSSDRDCQNYLLGGLLVLIQNYNQIKEFCKDLDILSTINFVTNPRAYKIKKLIST